MAAYLSRKLRHAEIHISFTFIKFQLISILSPHPIHEVETISLCLGFSVSLSALGDYISILGLLLRMGVPTWDQGDGCNRRHLCSLSFVHKVIC